MDRGRARRVVIPAPQVFRKPAKASTSSEGVTGEDPTRALGVSGDTQMLLRLQQEAAAFTSGKRNVPAVGNSQEYAERELQRLLANE